MPTPDEIEFAYREAFDDMTLHRAHLAGVRADPLDGPGGATRDALWPAFLRAHNELTASIWAELRATRLENVRLARALDAERSK